MSAVSVEENIPLVIHIVRKFLAGKPRWIIRREDDLRAAGMLGLVRAVETFNPDLGFKFSTYAWKCIANQIYKETGSWFYWSQSDIHPVSISQDRDIKVYARTESRLPEVHRKMAAVRAAARKRLRGRNLEIVELRFEGAKVDELAASFGISRQRVSQIIQRGYELIREEISASKSIRV